jgi:hypothetical protein
MIEHPGVGKRTDLIEAEPAKISARSRIQAPRVPAQPRIRLLMNRPRCTKDSITTDRPIGARLYGVCMKIEKEQLNPRAMSR